MRLRADTFALGSALLTLSIAVPPLATAQGIKIEEKLGDLERAARADSNDALAQYNLAIGYWSKKRYDQAERALRLATRLDPKFAEAYLALSYLPFARRPRLWDEVVDEQVPEKWTPAVEESDRLYRRAFLVNPLVDLRIAGAVTPPRDPAFVFNDELRKAYDRLFGGFEEFLAGRYDGAYHRIQRLIYDQNWDRHPDRIPSFVLWYHGLAAAHVERFDEAMESFGLLLDRSLDVERKDSLLHVPLQTNEYRYLMAVLHHEAGRLDEATSLFREALEHDLGLYMAHVRLAQIHETTGDLEEAVAERRRAIAAHPDDPSLLFDLGLTLVKQRRLDEGARALAKASEMNPRDARPLYVLALVQIELGRTSKARVSLERFLELAPSRYGGQITDAKIRLAALP